jgi:hypothetical protein
MELVEEDLAAIRKRVTPGQQTPPLARLERSREAA